MKVTVISGVYKTILYIKMVVIYCYLERDNDKILKLHFFF